MSEFKDENQKMMERFEEIRCMPLGMIRSTALRIFFENETPRIPVIVVISPFAVYGDLSEELRRFAHRYRYNRLSVKVFPNGSAIERYEFLHHNCSGSRNHEEFESETHYHFIFESDVEEILEFVLKTGPKLLDEVQTSLDTALAAKALLQKMEG